MTPPKPHHLPLLLLLLSTTPFPTLAWINPGTPSGVPIEYDCGVRQLAYEYGQHLFPSRGSFKTLFDALQLQNCPGNTTPTSTDAWTPPNLPTPTTGTLIYADAVTGSDDNPGTASKPVKSLDAAVGLSRRPSVVRPVTILLGAGSYFLASTLSLTPSDSDLSVQNLAGAHAVVSAGIPFSVPASSWKPWKVASGWDLRPDTNYVYGEVAPGKGAPGIDFIGQFGTASACEDTMDASPTTYHSFTYHHNASINRDYAGMCYGITTESPPVSRAQTQVDSGVNATQNTWVATLDPATAAKVMAGGGMTGLRLNSARAIRAKYPNGNPELSGEWYNTTDPAMGQGYYTHGWVADDGQTTWHPAYPYDKSTAVDLIASADDWPGVDWPMTRDGQACNGESNCGPFHIGMDGACKDRITPPVGYWCSENPPRGTQYVNRSPSGFTVPPAVLPHAPYKNPSTAVVQAWRGSGRWFSWHFSVLNQTTDASTNNTTFMFHRTVGGNQGGEGTDTGSQWWIENVLEECDAPMEFFYDDADGHSLYFSFNGSAGPTGAEQWVATGPAVLLNITGSTANPVTNVAFKGVEFSGTSVAYFEPQGLPTAGDWALPRSAALVFEGVDGVEVTDSYFHRLDNSAVLLSGRTRNVTVARNEFAWVGDNAIVLWGHTSTCLNANCSKTIPYPVGPDGRGGNQPRGTVISRNLIRELSIYEKQSSAFFQAVSQGTTFSNNVVFNGARALVNFNDGFGGGDVMMANLLVNGVRESGDHGPWNRIPYINDGDTIHPQSPRLLLQNLIIGYYASQESLDTDDGSSYFNVTGNVFPFAANGLKNDFGGGRLKFYSNLLVLVERCFTPHGTTSLTGYDDVFEGNTCMIRAAKGGYDSDCDSPVNMTISHNAVSTPSGTLEVCGTTMAKWLSEGHDPGSSISKWPSVDAVVAQAKELLGMTE